MKDFELLRMSQIWAIAREERLRMLNLLTREPLTVTGVARKLEMPANRAHYHVRQLLEHGLLEVVGTGRKRRREERYYRAVARNFLMDPALACGDGSTSAALRQSAEAAFLDWRRKEILDIDLGEVARTVVATCLGVHEDETVLVMFGPMGLELAEACVVEIEALGARPRPKLWSRNVVLRTLDRHDAASLARLPFLDAHLDGTLDAVLFISTHMPQGAPPSGAQREKLPIVLDAVSGWQQRIRERGARYLEVDLPHRGHFETGNVTPEAAIDLYWRCVHTDYERLAERAQSVRSRIRDGASLSLGCTRGTDLTVTVDLASAHVNDGVVSREDLGSGFGFDVLPAGSLTILPATPRASGTWVADYGLVGGRHVWNVALELRDGRITDVRGDSGAELIRGAIAHAAGDADLLASVRIGINPAGAGPTGLPVLDGCLAGTVTLGFGNNELLGGTTRATLDLEFPSTQVTVRAGEATLVGEGTLR